MVELRDFERYFHTVGTVGDKSIPATTFGLASSSNAPAIGSVITLSSGDGLHSNLSFFCALHEEYRRRMYDDDPFVALHQFKEVALLACSMAAGHSG